MPERLADNRGGIKRAERARNFLDVVRRCRRHDPVDHRAWEPDAVPDPSRQRRRAQTRKLQRRRAEPRAVGRNVVAADHRQRRSCSLPPPIERKRQQAEERAWRKGAFKVRAKRRIVEIERAGRRRQAIAFFGDRDRHHRNLRPAERGDGGLGARLVLDVDHVAQRADDTGLGVLVLS